MRTFTTHEMSVAMDRYNEIVTGPEDYWSWLAVDWEQALAAQANDQTNFGTGMFHIPDIAAARLDILLSPHYRTLMKAYQIKHGKDHVCDV